MRTHLPYAAAPGTAPDDPAGAALEPRRAASRRTRRRPVLALSLVLAGLVGGEGAGLGVVALVGRVVLLPAAIGAALPGPVLAADRRPGQNRARNRPQQERIQQTLPIDEAQAALRANEPQRALQITEQALKTQPDDAPLRFTRGLALVALGRPQEAEGVFRTLTQEFPELPEPYNNLAFVLAARGDLDGARMALEQALSALPDYPIAHENLGDIHVRLAARHFREASRLAAGSNRAVAESAAAKLKLIQQIDPTATAMRDPAQAQP